MYYFAYGSNLNEPWFTRLTNGIAKPIGKAKLSGYKLAFRRYLDIDHADGSIEVGVWEIPSTLSIKDKMAVLAKIDAYEGYPELYNRYKVKATLENGQEIEGIIYEMVNEQKRLLDGVKPSESYVLTCKDGYDFFKIKYNQMLEAL